MIKKIYNFFFPDDTKLKIECMTTVYNDNGVIKINRKFFTLRSIVIHYWYELFLNPLKVIQEIGRLRPGFYQTGAISFGATSNIGSDANDPTTFSHTTSGSNRVLVVSASSYRGVGSDPTYNGVSMTLGKTQSNPQASSFIHYLANPSTGANTVSWDASSGGMNQICAISFTGANTSSPLGATDGAQQTGGASTLSKAITTTYANSFLVDSFTTEKDSAHTFAPDGSQTQRMWNQTNSWIGGGASTLSTTTPGSYTMGWTMTSGSGNPFRSALAIIEIRELVASGPANLKSYNTNLAANIKSINTNLIANVKSLNTNV